MAESPKVLRVALYARVSTDMQARAEEGSLDTQIQRMKAYIAAKDQLCATPVVFREEGESGKSLDRPEVQRMLAKVRAREFDVVMVTRLDRLSRSLIDFYGIYQLFEENSVQFVSLNENFDTSTAVGRAMLKLVLVFAELEREQTAERTRTAMKARAERGLWNGGPPPLGYDSSGGGHLQVNPVEAELVRLIFEKYLELRSTVQLSRWLNDAGHRQKAYRSRRLGDKLGVKFIHSTVLGMLQNQIYIGRVPYKDATYEGQHQAIVDSEVFARVADIIVSNTKNVRGPPLRSQYAYALTGLLRCSCGYAMTTSAGRGEGGKNYFYYRCTGVITGASTTCTVKQVQAERVEKAVLSIVREAGRSAEIVEAAVAEANKLMSEDVEPLRVAITSLRRSLKEVEDEGQKVLVALTAAGIQDLSFAKDRLRELEVRRTQLTATVHKTEAELAVKETHQLDLDLVRQALTSFDEAYDHLSIGERRELLGLMISKIEVSPDQVRVDLYDGRRARTWLEAKGRKKKATSSEGSHPEFVAAMEWLPLSDLN